jgi:hypothetical protein
VAEEKSIPIVNSPFLSSFIFNDTKSIIIEETKQTKSGTKSIPLVIIG